MVRGAGSSGGGCFHSRRREAPDHAGAYTRRCSGRRLMKTIGIIAGGGALPCTVAQSVEQSGDSVFIVGLRGAADDGIGRFPHDWVSLGEAGKVLRLLREHGCRDVLLAGRVSRPRFSDLKTDTRGVLLVP